MTVHLVAQHLGGIPELAMALGPLLLIAVFIKIARSAEVRADDDPVDEWDDWDDAQGSISRFARARKSPTSRCGVANGSG